MKNQEFTGLLLMMMMLPALILLAVLLWMPVMRGEKAFFGVRVSREVYEGEGRRVLKRYWLSLLAAFTALVSAGMLTAYYRQNLLYAAFAYIASWPVAFALYVNFAREMRPFRVVSESTRFASSLKVRRLADYTSYALEAFIILLTLAPAAVLVYFYPALPERIPIHWGPGGQPDGWAQKSFATVFFLPVLTVYLQGFFLLLKHDLVHAKMTLLAEQAEIYLKHKERMLVASLRMMDWVRGMLSWLLGLVSLFVVLTSIERLRHLMPAANALLWVCLGLLMAVLGFYLYRLMQITNELDEATGDATARRESEEQHWSGGGLFYYNPDDPALMIEKKEGLGYTYNFAGKGIKLRMLFLSGVPLLALWALWGL